MNEEENIQKAQDKRSKEGAAISPPRTSRTHPRINPSVRIAMQKYAAIIRERDNTQHSD